MAWSGRRRKWHQYCLMFLFTGGLLFGRTAVAQQPIEKEVPLKPEPSQPLTERAQQQILQYREALKEQKPITRTAAEAILRSFYNPGLMQAAEKPDLIIMGVQACRSPRGDGYVDWSILVSVKNAGGSHGISDLQMPLALYVRFDPSMPWGQGSLGDAGLDAAILSQQKHAWMQVPTEAGSVRSWVFKETYRDEGPCQRPCYRKVPLRFTLFADQLASGDPGPIAESNEYNNGSGVEVTGHDDVNGYTGVPQWCWYSPR